VCAYTLDDSGRHASAVACAFLFAGPRYRNELALIVLSTGFFDKQPHERTLRLLHECIHLRLMMDPLRDRAIENIELDRTHRTQPSVAGDERLFMD
jgi:hypothetical protein